MKEIPEIARRGKLIETANPQPEVRRNAESAKDWDYADEASYLYEKANLFKERFLDPIARTDRGRLPDPVISFESRRNWNILATYTLVRNPQGLLYEITMNSQHYVDKEENGAAKKVWEFGRWAQLETLLHEQVHLWQQNFGEDPLEPRKPYHNKEFVKKCESLGLHPKLGEGYHTQLADGPFKLLMEEMGINPPDLTKKPAELNIDWFKWLLDFKGKKRKGRSSLTKWSCPDCGLNARIGIKGNPELTHNPCGSVLIRSDGLPHTLYDSGKK